jgi:hypothetical protein
MGGVAMVLVKQLRLYGLVCYSLAIVVTTGCTTQQAYSTSQEWQRNQCNRIVDNVERSRCIEQINMPYSDYKRQADALKK